MKVYTCTNFHGMQPTQTAAVVVARDAIEARDLLETKLAEVGLRQTLDPKTIKPLNTRVAGAIVLSDGDY